MNRRTHGIIALATLAAHGCGGGSEAGSGAAGQPVSSSSAAAGTGAAMPATGSPVSEPGATFSEVYEMLFPMPTNARCVACHSMPPNDIANGNLQMGADKAAAYAALVGRMSTSSRCMSRPLVVPSQPETSLLLEKLGATPPCGSRMPLGGNMLTDAQIAIVRSWIAAGAKDD